MTVQRPRVAAIGLDDARAESIRPICGTLRMADSPAEYLAVYSWDETDIAVIARSDHSETAHNVHVLAFGSDCKWSNVITVHGGRYLASIAAYQTTEREVSIGEDCPHGYKDVASELSRLLARADDPPPVYEIAKRIRDDCQVLIRTTTNRSVAIRHLRVHRPWEAGRARGESVLVAVPRAANLAAWFHTFLTDVHENDPVRVPHPPPRLGHPADWYTPQEKGLAGRITATTDRIGRLKREREQLRADLVTAGEQADMGIRRVLWADGEELVAGVTEILTSLGFRVRDMDSELAPGSPKGEDLRLTLDGPGEWEALVEVKGYTRGTKTNDARQIRAHRELYIQETGRLPDLTLWIANPHRLVPDPSLRPAPDRNVADAASNVGTVHVLVPDLYRQWARAADGEIQASDVIQQLASAASGCWHRSE